MEKYKLILVNDKISLKDIAKQAGISIQEVKKHGDNLKLKEILTLKEARILEENMGNIKIIDCKNLKTKLQDLDRVLKKDKKIPIISIMGHIDHGKTTLVDQIMKTEIASHEIGGITQNISLYKIKYKNQEFFLIDTPGHQIFSHIRKFIMERTDILVLLVAADDGVNSLTEEIVLNSKDNETIICINKIDKGTKNLETIYRKLSELGLTSSEYYGETLTCKISAKNGEKIDELLDCILLKSEFIEQFADKKQDGIGYVLDSKSIIGMGLVSKILLTSGTINLGDKFICGNVEGVIKRIFINNKQVVNASFNDLIDIVGFTETPEPGNKLFIINNDVLRKQLLSEMTNKKNVQSLEENQVKFILKAENINHLSTLEQLIKNKGLIIHKSIGGVTDNEIEQAKIFKGVFVFWGDVSSKNLEILNKNKISFVHDNIIYNIIEKIDKLLAPPKEIVFEKLGTAKVLKIFNINGSHIAGCKVLDGTIKKGVLCRVLRNNEKIFEGNISSMKREKNTITEAITNSECGIIFNKNVEISVGDIIEAIEEKKD